MFVHAHWEVIPEMDLAAAILTLHRDDGMKATVDRATGLRCILAEYWAKIIRKQVSPPEVQLLATMLHFLFPFASEETKDNTKFMEILNGSGGSYSHLAYLLVRQINNTVKNPVTASTARIVDSVLQALHLHGGGPLDTQLLAHGGAKALVDAIHFSEKARPFNKGPLPGEGVYLGVIYLSGNFSSNAGAAWVSQTLSAGLVRLIAVLGRPRQKEMDEPYPVYGILQKFLLYTLPEFLLHRKITRQIKDALPVTLSITSTAPFTTCVIYPVWIEFTELVQERLGALDLLPESRSLSVNACENVQVISRPCLQICGLSSSTVRQNWHKARLQKMCRLWSRMLLFTRMSGDRLGGCTQGLVSNIRVDG